MKSQRTQNIIILVACLLFIVTMYIYISAIIRHYEIVISNPEGLYTSSDVPEETDIPMTPSVTPTPTPIRTVDIPETFISDVESVETIVAPSYTYYNVPLDEDLQEYILDQCADKYVNPKLIFAMIYVESSYRSSAIGDNGNSFGLMQIQPRWHQERMDKLGCPDLLDPYQNVTVGIDYIADLIGRKGSIEWALMAYNSGPSIANKKFAAGELTKYVTKVFEKMNDITEVTD